MNITIFSALYKPSIGGVENYTEQLSKALSNHGHRVVIVTHNIDESPLWEEEGNRRILHLPCRQLLDGRLPIPRRSPQSTMAWKRLSDLPCDGVLINTRFYPLSLQAARYAQKRGLVPLILEHGSAHLTLNNKVADSAINAYEHGISALLKRCHPRFYGVSSASCKWLKHFGIKAQGTLPNAIDVHAFLTQSSSRNFLQEYPQAHSDRIISFVGRLVPEKGIRQLIEAMRILEQDRYSATLFVAGDGTLKNELISIAPKNVIFLGSLGKSDVAALLQQSNLFCLPSRSEGFATSLLEASACSTASLVTNIGGAAELIPNASTGTILTTAEPDEIAVKIKQALSNPLLLAAQGNAVRILVEHHYSWGETAARVVSALSSAD